MHLAWIVPYLCRKHKHFVLHYMTNNSRKVFGRICLALRNKKSGIEMGRETIHRGFNGFAQILLDYSLRAALCGRPQTDDKVLETIEISRTLW